MQILMLIVLARLLTPRDFGIMGVALLTLSGLNRFTEIGLNSALIQQKAENVDDYLNTTWCLEAGRGILIVAGLFVLAPYIASFFDEPAATAPIRVIAISTLLFGFRNPAVVYFKKDLEFHKQFVYEVSGGFVQFIIGVSYALVSPTVWALVFASTAVSVNKFVLSYAMHEYRPWPSFDFEKAKELIQYGKWITGASIVGFLYSEGDDAFVGWLLTSTALGYYQYAYRIADTPSSEVSSVISQVTFPAYSRLQGDMDALRDGLLETLRFTSFITFPMAFGIALVAPSFVPAVLGSDWTPMITAMQILALYGLLHAITANFGEVWKALGRPDYEAKIGAFRVLCIAVVIWPATARWGIEGTALAVVGVHLFPTLPLSVYLVAKSVEGRSMQIYREYVYPFVAASVMFVNLWYARTLVDLSPLVEFLALVPAGTAIYVLTSFVLNLLFDWGIEKNIRMLLNGIRG